MEERGTESPRTLKSWRRTEVAWRRSPDGRYLLVRASTMHPPAELYRPEMTSRWLYETATGTWRPWAIPPSLAAAHPEGEAGDIHAEWAGPATLVWNALGAIAFEDLDAPGRVRYVAEER